MTFSWKQLLQENTDTMDAADYERLENIAGTLDFLTSLQETHSTSLSDPQGKTFAANEAIGAAFSLLCGETKWALHHLIGLADGNHVGEPTLRLQADPRDTHVWEDIGKEITHRTSSKTPSVRRRALTNVISALRPAGTPLSKLFFELNHSLRALDTGEQFPLLSPESSTQKAKYLIQLHHLSAVCFEEFLVNTGSTYGEARQLLQDCYGRNVRPWRKRLLEQPFGLSPTEIENSLQMARIAARSVVLHRQAPEYGHHREMASQAMADYGEEAIRADSQSYRLLIRQNSDA